MTTREHRRPRIGVLLGDPSGIGPEIVVKLLARPQIYEHADVIVLTDPSMQAAGEAVAGVQLSPDVAADWETLHFAPGRPTLLQLLLIAQTDIVVGQATAASGQASMKSLEAAVGAAKSGAIDGIVFGPLNKHAMYIAGLAYEDEMRFMKALFGHERSISEFNITGALWTSRVTSHIPISAVADHITHDGVCDAIVDAHQHFWDPERNYHPWLADKPVAFHYGDYSATIKRYLPADYLRDARNYRVAGTVYIETEWEPRDPVGEMAYVMELRRVTGYPSVAVAQAWLDREDAGAGPGGSPSRGTECGHAVPGCRGWLRRPKHSRGAARRAGSRNRSVRRHA